MSASTKLPVANAVLSPAGITTGVDGRFTVQGTGTRTSLRWTIVAPGFVTRDTTVAASANNVTLDVISLTALNFYRQLVRDGYDSPGLLAPLRRWTSTPNFYINTLKPDGTQVDATESLAVVRTWIVNAVPAWTDGQMQAGTIETGTAARPLRAGWINVDFLLTDTNVCGRSLVGGNPGAITLHNDYCACGSTKIAPATIVHEVGHAMGFYHVSDRHSVMYPQVPGGCTASVLSNDEKLNSATAYERQPGNVDPDSDPLAQGQLAASAFVAN